MQSTDQPALIGLDWGTSALRAYLFNQAGDIVAREASDNGIQSVPDQQFRAVFETCCAAWLSAEPAIPVIACGMVGSQQGWREAGYAECPADLNSLSRAITRIDELAGRRFAIVPGLKKTGFMKIGSAADFDVMRGEETQILGLCHAADSNDLIRSERVYVLPGSHSKWVRAVADQVLDFRSFLTGELYSAVAGHTLVGRLFPANSTDFDNDAFAAGVACIRESPNALTAHLFSVRAQGLLGQRLPAALPSYLSGLLIGSELIAALDSFTSTQPITLVGTEALVQRYQCALELFGLRSLQGTSDSAAQGLFYLARQAGLFGTQ